MKLLSDIIREAKEAPGGKYWALRIPLLLYFAYVLIKHLSDPSYRSIIAPLNLGIHELGHVILYPLGMFIGTLGGSLAQCLAPILGMINFYARKDFYALILCFGWLSVNLFEVAAYLADARAQQLPLLGFTENPIHDWNYLLNAMNLLPHDKTIAAGIMLIAAAVMFICLIAGGALVWHQAKNSDTNEENPVKSTESLLP